MTWPAARRLSSGALSPGAVARRPTHHTTLAVRRPLLVVRCSSLVARITLRVTRRSLFVARCSLSVGPSLAPECTQSLLVASSLWGLTARRCAAAPSGLFDPPHPGCGRHHRLVRPERANRFCKPCGQRFFACHLRRSLPAGRCSLFADRRTQAVARRPSHAARRPTLVACRRAPCRPTPPLAAQRLVARRPRSSRVGRRSWFAARRSSPVVR